MKGGLFLLGLLGLLGLAAAQCTAGPAPINYTAVNIPADGSQVTIEASYKQSNGQLLYGYQIAYPPTCGWLLTANSWTDNQQIVATWEYASVNPSVASNGWSVTLTAVTEGQYPPASGTQVGSISTSVRIPPVNGGNVADMATSGTKNTTDPVFATWGPRKEMILAVSFAGQGGDFFAQPPLLTIRFKITFRLSADMCPADSSLWVPRKLGTSPHLTSLTAACANYNNLSCCNPSNAVAAERLPGAGTSRQNFIEVWDDPQNSGGSGDVDTPIAAAFNHQWAANDTECYHYYQVAACGARCSPNAATMSYITTNWLSASLRKTFWVCSSFCARVYGACKNLRLKDYAGVTPGALGSPIFTRGVQISDLYGTSETAFCRDFFAYTYPPMASGKAPGGAAETFVVAIPQPNSQGAPGAANAMQIDVRSGQCYDPSQEPGSASALSASLLLLLITLIFSL